MEQFFFYFRYALRNLTRGGRWTIFAMLCISAGVATVVSLRSLGLSIEDSLLNNVRITNKGDFWLQRGSSDPFGFDDEEDERFFSTGELQQVTNWVEEQQAEMSLYMIGQNIQIAATDFVSVGRPQFAQILFIDPETYPPSHEIRTIDPKNVPIEEILIGDTNEVIISENLASAQGLEVGDAVRVSRTEETFTVVGIVGAEHESNLRNPFSSFFGFAYFHRNSTAVLDMEFQPSHISIQLPDNPTSEQIETGERELRRMTRRTSVRTTNEILEENEFIAQFIGDFIIVMGLGALLIGGVGIMNTMLVMVRRRTNEIAALKTFGLKGRQVAFLFLAEGLVLGFVGSVIGSIVGSLISGLVNQYGETLLNQQLAWRIYPEAILFGFVLGILVTVIFGVAPILTAIKVRPGIILRPNETHIPKLGIIQSLVLMVLIVVALGLIVGQIVTPSFDLVASEASPKDVPPSPYLVGVIGVAGTLLFLAILVGLLWIVVWIVSKVPSFGSVDLRLALRNLSTHRIRTATTLLALSAGMFALSAITFVGQGVRELINVQLTDQFGGNILVFPLPLVSQELMETGIDNALQDVEVAYKTKISIYEDVTLIAIDGTPLGDIRSTDFESGFERFQWETIQSRTTNRPRLTNGTLVAGRDLTVDDTGKNIIVGPPQGAEAYGMEIGSILEYRIEGEVYEFELVGFVEPQSELSFANVTIPDGVLDSNDTNGNFFTFDIDNENVNQALVNLSTVPLIFTLDLAFLDSFISRLIDQFAAIPTVVGLLSLGAAAVIMANTVALSTLERRRQIGILKAVGLKSKRVLGVMLIENTVVGLLSALIGLGLSSLIISIITAQLSFVIPLPEDSRLTAIGLVIAAVVIGWTATFLSARVATNERVMNVLRYE